MSLLPMGIDILSPSDVSVHAVSIFNRGETVADGLDNSDNKAPGN